MFLPRPPGRCGHQSSHPETHICIVSCLKFFKWLFKVLGKAFKVLPDLVPDLYGQPHPLAHPAQPPAHPVPSPQQSLPPDFSSLSSLGGPSPLFCWHQEARAPSCPEGDARLGFPVSHRHVLSPLTHVQRSGPCCVPRTVPDALDVALIRTRFCPVPWSCGSLGCLTSLHCALLGQSLW